MIQSLVAPGKRTQVNVPRTIAAINHLPVAKQREVLHYHDFPILDTKDQLALRVYLLRHGQTSAIIAREEEEIKDLIRIYKVLALSQKKLQLNQFVPPPTNISSANLHELFDPLVAHLDNQRCAREEKDRMSTVHLVTGAPPTCSSIKEKVSQVGAKVKIKWTLEEIGGSG